MNSQLAYSIEQSCKVASTGRTALYAAIKGASCAPSSVAAARSCLPMTYVRGLSAFQKCKLHRRWKSVLRSLRRTGNEQTKFANTDCILHGSRDRHSASCGRANRKKMDLAGELNVHRLGGAVRISEPDLNAFLSGRRE